MELYLLRIVSIVVIAFAYMIFDIFNRKNVPLVFIFGTLAYGALLTILYFNTIVVVTSCIIAAIFLGAGYHMYKLGELGAADVVEITAISLMLPVQYTAPFGITTAIFSFPFILSVLVNAGIIALITVPIYYLPKAKAKLQDSFAKAISKIDIGMSVSFAVIFIAFLYVTVPLLHVSTLGLAGLLVILICTFFLMLFAKPITYSMVDFIDVKKFTDGDMVALNLMKSSSLKKIRKKVKGFGRLLTTKTIEEMKTAKIKEKVPVYKRPVPLAVAIFVAVVVSLLLGNLLFLMLGV